jgi:hypothetical protein
MKIWILKLLFTGMFAVSLEATNIEKIYISEESVSLYNKQIFVRFGRESAPVLKLSSDSLGLYILKEDLPFGFWVCANGHVNYPWNFACSTCGSN